MTVRQTPVGTCFTFNAKMSDNKDDHNFGRITSVGANYGFKVVIDAGHRTRSVPARANQDLGMVHVSFIMLYTFLSF